MSHWALLLIDIQRDFYDIIASDFPGYSESVSRLLGFARGVGMLVVHVRAEFSPDMSDWMIRYRSKGKIPCLAGTPGAEVMSFAAPADGELTMVKKRFSAFCRTGLEHLLRSRDVETVVVGGLVTSICVGLTVADAYQRDYVPLIVRECVADLPARHEMALSFMHRFIADVLSLEKLMTYYERWQQEDAVRQAGAPYDFERFG